MHLVHCLLHAILCAIELLAHTFPVALVRSFGDRFSMRRDGVSHADSLSQRQDFLPNLFNGRRILCLHSHESIGNHRPQQKSDPRPLGKTRALVGSNVFLPVDRAQFIQRAKDFIRQRNHHVFHRF